MLEHEVVLSPDETEVFFRTETLNDFVESRLQKKPTSLSEGLTLAIDQKNPITDCDLEWSEDLEINFRIVHDKRVNQEKQFKLFPDLDSQRRIPSIEAFRIRAERKLKKSKKRNSGPRNPKPPSQLTSKSKCHICRKVFNTEAHLEKHIATHTRAKPFKCPVCQWGFCSEDNLKRHIKSSHSGYVPKETQKPENNDSLTQVQVKSTTESTLKLKPLVLSLKNLNSPRPVFNGLQTITNIKPLINSQSPIGNHESHLFKGFRCNFCSKCFATKENLQEHIPLHQKSLKCGICNTRFSHEHSYKIHLATVHHVLGHPCPHCSINFRTQEDALQHIASMHSAVLSPA